ncbi:MAG: Histone acetyltransferase kat6b, partial [Paramarteilia canceri]
MRSNSRSQARKQLFEREKTTDEVKVKYISQIFDSDLAYNISNLFELSEKDTQILINDFQLCNNAKIKIADDAIYPEKLKFGDYLLKCSYSSPYPYEYSTVSTLNVCHFCFKYFMSPKLMQIHLPQCHLNGSPPPGDLIYEEDELKVYEIDGKKERLYCQNLCLMSRSFLDYKTLYNNVETFLFYILLTENSQDKGNTSDSRMNLTKFSANENEILEKNKENLEKFQIMGYFSKEKTHSAENYNLSCIVIFPPFLRKGHGFFLIDI